MQTNVQFLVLALAMFFGLVAPAQAQDQKDRSIASGWTVVQMVGEVVLEGQGITKVAISPSQSIPGGTTIVTGETGRAILLRGRETVVLSPSSRLTLPKEGEAGFSRARQHSGSVLFKVGKKPQAHFTVDTPYLAAVVKGTTFTVSVTAAGASVHVQEGAVEVQNLSKTQAILTRAGQVSSVFANALEDVFVSGVPRVIRNDYGTWNSVTDVFTPREYDMKNTVEYRNRMEFSVASRDALELRPGQFKRSSGRGDKPEPKSVVLVAASKIETAPVQRVSTSDLTAKLKPRKEELGTEKGNPKKASEPLEAEKAAPGKAMPKPESAAWSVIQAKGSVRVDGFAYKVGDAAAVRTLQPGAKVQTGEDGHLVLERRNKQFSVAPNSVAILPDHADDDDDRTVLVSASAANRSPENASPKEFGAGLDAFSGFKSNADPAGSGRESLQDMRYQSTKPTTNAPVSKAARAQEEPEKKTTVQSTKKPLLPKVSAAKAEEAKEQVIGSVTLILYAITAALVLFFGAQFAMKRYRNRMVQAAQDPAAVRLRAIGGGQANE